MANFGRGVNVILGEVMELTAGIEGDNASGVAEAIRENRAIANPKPLPVPGAVFI